VAEQNLDEANIHFLFEQMGGKTVALMPPTELTP